MVIVLLHEVKDTLTASQCATSYRAGNIFTVLPGRPKFYIPKEQVQFLDRQWFSIPAIADSRGESERRLEILSFA